MDTLRRFSVYYLGSQQVPTSGNSDEVVDVIQVSLEERGEGRSEGGGRGGEKFDWRVRREARR